MSFSTMASMVIIRYTLKSLFSSKVLYIFWIVVSCVFFFVETKVQNFDSLSQV